MKRNMKEWTRSLMSAGERMAMPIMTYPGLYFTGKKIPDLVTRGEDHFLCIKALADRYPSAAAVSVMDLSLEAEAFGASIALSDDDVPTVRERLVNDRAGIDALAVPEPGKGRTKEYLKAASLAAQNIADKPVFAGMIGPYSLAGRLFDISEFMVNVLIDPEGSHALLAKCTAFLKKYALAYKAAGCNGVVIAEPAAGLLAEDTCHEFSSKYVKEIVDEVQDEYFMVILHNCGNTRELVSSMASTGAAGLHFGNAVNMEEILPQVPSDRLAFGNIDPSGVFRNGNPATVKEAVKTLLAKTASYRNYVLSSGCDVPPHTPIENVNAFYEALQEYNRFFRK